MSDLLTPPLRLSPASARLTSVERCDQYIRSLDYEAASHVPEHAPPADWPQRGGLELRQVCLRYRPDLPRVKLTLPTLAPSLVYLDRRDGRLLEEVRLSPELHQLSIRHLAVGAGDRVAIAMQYEGPFGDPVPLVALHRRGEQPLLLEAPRPVLRRMRQYSGGAAFDRAGRILAVSAPRGNRLVFWDAEEGRFLSSVDLADGCGVAPTEAPGQFLASSGVGGVIVVDAASGTSRRLDSDFLDASQWDNHLMVANI